MTESAAMAVFPGTGHGKISFLWGNAKRALGSLLFHFVRNAYGNGITEISMIPRWIY